MPILSLTKKAIVLSLSIFFLLLAQTACSKDDKKDYNAVRNNMSLAQVEKLLGHPDYTKTLPVAGFQGLSAAWQYKNQIILIQFFDGHVVAKSSKALSTP